MTVPATARETFTGRYIDLADPQPEDICLEDIAHHLSLLCRYGGSVRKFYSVAEHAVLVSRRVEQKGGSRDQQLLALHHDSAEAYLVDIPRPQKLLIGVKYEWLTTKVDTSILVGLGLPLSVGAFHDPIIKDADNWALHVEARHLMPSAGKRWAEQYPERVVTPDFWLGGLDPAEAERFFIDQHEELTA